MRLRLNIGVLLLGLAAVGVAAPIMLSGVASWFGSPQLSIKDLKRLRLGDPMELSGIVTFSDHRHRWFYLQDESGGIRVELRDTPPRVGQRVTVRARIGVEYDAQAGLRSVAVSDARLIAARTGALPAPHPVALADLFSNSERREGTRVQISGVVRAADIDAERVTLEVGDDGQRMTVTVLDADAIDPELLIDARITISGTLQLGLDRIAEAFSPQLWVASARDVRVETAAPASVPLVSNLLGLLTDPQWVARGHRVRLRAKVLKTDASGRLLVANGGLLLPVELDGTDPALPGDYVEVSGWPTRQRWNVVLARASVARIDGTNTADIDAGLAGSSLTRIEQVRQLTSAEASKNLPVEITGVVTAVQFAHEFLFVQLGDTGIFVDAWGQSLHTLKTGTLVRITGITGAGEFAPVIAQPWLQTLGAAPLPEPLAVDPDAAPSGAYDSKWVELEGSVRPFVATVGAHEFNLETALGPVGGILIGAADPASLDGLIDARIRVRGVFATSFTNQGVLTGYRLFVQSLDFIEVLRPAPDMEDLDALRPIGELLRFRGSTSASRRMRVRGTVTMRVADRLYLEDSSGSLQVQGANADIAVGDVVEAVGYPNPSIQGPLLVDATVVLTGQRGAIEPSRVTPEQVLSGKFENRLVRIEARLVSQGASAIQQTLILQSGNHVFSAELDGSVPLPSLREGSIVEVVGICAAQHQHRADSRFGYGRDVDSFRIVLRSPADTSVVSAAPWWTLRHAWPALALLMLATALAMLWARSLRKRVASQTAEIERQSAFFRQVIDMCPDRIYVKDRDGRYTLVNRALAQEYGRAPESVVGKRDIELGLDERLAREVALEDREVIETGSEKTIAEHSRTDRTGGTLWFHTVKRPIRAEEGAAWHVLGVSNEITEHKDAERTLVAARASAEAANRAKSEFLANMSHEIRTPLNGIIGMSELCLDTELSGEQREYVQALKISGDGLLSVVNDILDFSKLEAGKLELEQRRFDIRATLEGALKTLALQAHGKNVELLYEAGAQVPVEALGDANRLRQVMLNVIGEAIRTTERSEVLVELRLLSQDDLNCNLQFTVTHRVSDDDQRSKFEALRPEQGTSQLGGAELGLTISERLVTLMNGRIWAERSPARERAHFTVRLGAVLDQAPFQPQSGTRAMRDVRVLVVDDNVTGRGILERALTSWGMRPVGAGSASEAFERMQELARTGDPCSVVLIDLEMPVPDGWSLIERIREGRLAVAIIAMSASHAQHRNSARARGLRIDACLAKPIRPLELHESLVRALEQCHPERCAASPAVESATRSLDLLVAEDNTVNQMVMQRLLQKRGHRVTIAATGRAALDAHGRDRFDLILMDVQMPELDGLQTTREIRRRETESGKHAPIVALTAHALSGDRERCLAAGMDGYLTKPVNPRELDDVLAKYDKGGRRAAHG